MEFVVWLFVCVLLFIFGIVGDFVGWLRELLVGVGKMYKNVVDIFMNFVNGLLIGYVLDF